MFRKTGVTLLAVVCVFALSGCATGRRQKDLEVQGLRNQVLALEAQLASKDDEINSLKGELSKAQESQAFAAKGAGETKSRPKVKEIQLALANAGYNPGPIDGKMGRQTREAIKAFQKANGLGVDGRVGKKTWELLRKYLSQKIK